MAHRKNGIGSHELAPDLGILCNCLIAIAASEGTSLACTPLKRRAVGLGTFNRGLTVFFVRVPLAWAVLLLFHPLTSGAAYEGLRDAVTRWQVVHVGTLIFIGLMGLAVCLLVRDLTDQPPA